MRTTRLRVELLEVAPPVVRVLDVPVGVLLPELHDLLQVGLGWTDSHLHQFVADGVCYGVPGIDGPDDERDEGGVLLRTLPSRFRYLYDFGDGWEHEVEVVGSGGQLPGCIAGEGACPPEDVGGPPGYADFLKTLADPHHPDHDHMRAWAGTWSDRFALAVTDRLVRQTAGTVPEPVHVILDLTSAGVKLTPGGRLPRAVVRQVQQRYPRWSLEDRPASLEEDLPPLAVLHDLLREVGLLRLHHGVLRPTRAASDDLQVVRRVRSWFGPEDGFVSILVGVVIATLASSGPTRPENLAAKILSLLGDRWVTGEGEPLDEHRTRIELFRLQAVLQCLDLIDSDHGTWSAGPSALSLLPRATRLAHLWSNDPTA